MENTIQAKSLTKLQLKMLDIGAPVVVTCKTLTGETVNVRLQTQNLDPLPENGSNGKGKRNGGHGKGCWENHGVYVAIMPNGGKK